MQQRPLLIALLLIVVGGLLVFAVPPAQAHLCIIRQGLESREGLVDLGAGKGDPDGPVLARIDGPPVDEFVLHVAGHLVQPDLITRARNRRKRLKNAETLVRAPLARPGMGGGSVS